MPASLHSFLAASRPPQLFYPALFVFNLFPLHFPITLWGLDAPYGRFGGQGGWLYLNGNISWCIMELAGPLTMYSTLWSCARGLTPTAKVLVGLYTIHYIHRAIVSPLILSPTRSKQHVVVPLLAGLFNLFNGFLLGCSLVYFPPLLSIGGPRFTFAILGWLAGFVGNIYHDEILNDLRRSASSRRVSTVSKEDEEADKKEGNGRYLVPRGGLFKFISFPNYFCESIEWIFFAYLATAPHIPSSYTLKETFLLPVPALSHLSLSSFPALRSLFLAMIPEALWPLALVNPPWLFALNTIANLTPRAIRGHAWYKRTFGERVPEGRKAIVPYIL